MAEPENGNEKEPNPARLAEVLNALLEADLDGKQRLIQSQPELLLHCREPSWPENLVRLLSMS
jgi:hypothetical protein